MPYAYSDLEFWESPDHPPDVSRLPPMSTGVPVRLRQAGRSLNFGLLVGEILGIDTQVAQPIIEDIDRLPDSIAHVFVEEDLTVLLEVFSQVSSALAAAVDSKGHPQGDQGQILVEHPLIGQSDEGRLFFHSQRVDLADLQFDLDCLCRFLIWAIDHALLVQKLNHYE
jgi:hypothetical protein